MHYQDDPYVNFLISRKEKVLYLKPYAGNAGDSLIRRGMQTMLSELSIQESVDPRKADVLVMPGGNAAMWPSVHVPLWRELWRRFPDKEFVIGPSGFRGGYFDWADLIRHEGLPVTGVFTRDPISYETLKSADLPSRITIGLSHDPALRLHQSEWLRVHREAVTAEYTLISFRDDQEGNIRYTNLLGALRKYLPARIYNRVSRIESSLVKGRKIKVASQNADKHLPFLIREASKQSLEMFLETVRCAKEVHTDRLHVLLLAAMLGKKVFAYQAIYDKLENVYNHSLKDWADVTFVAID